jgi:formylglycine-generating enzyme required for sulfatase activity
MTDLTLVPGTGGPEGYRLLDLLGRGAFGEVWRAEAPGGVKVAVKILSLTLKPAEAKRELAALHSILELRHPYLLSLQAIFYQGDRIFVVMELADGSLGSRLAECQDQGQPGIPAGELLGYMREAAEAIDYLHANERLHRDIKPDNILLLARHAKVADYGLARVLEKQQTAQTKSVVGTPSFMAPETWEGTVGPRSDQYSLGAAYVELRCGRRPFEAATMPQLMKMHTQDDPDLGGIPAAERPVVAKALAKQSADRYPTCKAFATALVRAVQADAAKKKELLAAPTEEHPPARKPNGNRAAGDGSATRRYPAARPGGEGRKKPSGGSKAAALVVVVLLVCSLGGGLAIIAWPKGGPDTSKTQGPVALNLTGGDVAEVAITSVVKMKFCWIPPGKATLGSPALENGHDDSEKEHDYTSRGFWLAKYPVTQDEWRALMKDNPSPSYFKPEQDDVKKAGITDTSRFPVENVSWNDCQDILKVMNAAAQVQAAMGRGKFVLPYEDEWEYACRGGKGNKQAFYFGNQLNGDKANCGGNFPYGTETKGTYKQRTTAVGEYEGVAPHPWGLCDMHGNVWQWCENKYSEDKDSRALRGGSWHYSASYCRAAGRSGLVPGIRGNDGGFRPCFRLD